MEGKWELGIVYACVESVTWQRMFNIEVSKLFYIKKEIVGEAV
ncbi:hypothetical protein KDAU_72200 [Dictyobacter aurantiacus]|uniref:Uncharacterized protein n=1 Tax=Dictyobacter aurantiacus TaxID=1936993 RepID=A0A401ZSQ6_9CHLR|nr:hypothetical protein KDAU_72200 [Dictyobacter aurantiacus]